MDGAREPVGVPALPIRGPLGRRGGDAAQWTESESEELRGTSSDAVSDTDDAQVWVSLDRLPAYLQRQITALWRRRDRGDLVHTVRRSLLGDAVAVAADADVRGRNSGLDASWPDVAGLEIRVLTTPQTQMLASREEIWVQLLLALHYLTTRIGGDGLLRPDVILERARCYECLGYDELAVGDAYVAFTLAGGESEDLLERTVGTDGEEWDVEGDDASKVKVGCLRIMVRALHRLGAVSEVERWVDLLAAEGYDIGDTEDWRLFASEHADGKLDPLEGVYGKCQRVVYPWNEHEPDRMSPESLAQINERLRAASHGMLECRKTILPSLSSFSAEHPSTASDIVTFGAGTTENAQLGLFASVQLPASTSILHERSPLTGIRPHDAALCDCCATDLESIDPSSRASCPACSIPFCSPECLNLAESTYHCPSALDETTQDDYPSSTAPFCPGPSIDLGFSDLGKAESSSTPEWDLYFLLVVRCIQMAITLDVHPLDLFEVKYLWGSLTPAPELTSRSPLPAAMPARLLPFSLNHHVAMPFQLFEYLLLSLPHLYPFSAAWLERFDFWTINTLYAKFRGVATGSQSSFDGKPETAQVHPLWCLANHSCEPNVSWEPGGVRGFKVRGDKTLSEGEEIWNHYTDVGEKDVRTRRGRLKGVLGGDCMCGRCVRENEEMIERGKMNL